MKQVFNLTNVWDQEVMEAAMQWFGKMDLHSLCETIDRLNNGETPEPKIIVVSQDQPDYDYPSSIINQHYELN